MFNPEEILKGLTWDVRQLKWFFDLLRRLGRASVYKYLIVAHFWGYLQSIWIGELKYRHDRKILMHKKCLSLTKFFSKSGFFAINCSFGQEIEKEVIGWFSANGLDLREDVNTKMAPP